MEDTGDDIYDDPKSLQSNQTSVRAIAQMFANQPKPAPAPHPIVPKKTWKPPVNSGGTATPIIMMKPPTAKKPAVASKPEPHPNKPAVPKRSPVSPGLKAGVGISMDELKATIQKKSTGSHSDLTGSKPQVPRRSPQTAVSPTIPHVPLKHVNNSPKAPHDNERIPAPNRASPTENDGGKAIPQPLPPLEVLGEPPKKPARPPEVQLPEVQTEGQKRSLPHPPPEPDEVFEEDEDGDMYEDVETARARLQKERQEASSSDIKPMEEEDEEDVYEDTENRPPPLPSPRTPGFPMPSPVPSALHGMALPATPKHKPEPEDDDETYDDIRPNQQGRNDSEEEGEDEDLYEGLDEVQEQVSQLDRRMGTFSHLPFRLWGSNGSTPVNGKSESSEDLLDKDKKSRKKDEKLRKEQERKEQKEREEREKREKKEAKKREKEEKEVKKKFKLRPDDRLETLSRGRVLHIPDKTTKHDKLDLLVKQGELLTVVKMEDCPEGKWLARNTDGRYGYIVANSLEMDTQSVKSSSSSFMGAEEDDCILWETYAFGKSW
ncbi:uncharacterized protein LOC144903185 isoform X3 [Branchiostoma floridae x Branchiostoma belcheri]